MNQPEPDSNGGPPRNRHPSPTQTGRRSFTPKAVADAAAVAAQQAASRSEPKLRRGLRWTGWAALGLMGLSLCLLQSCEPIRSRYIGPRTVRALEEAETKGGLSVRLWQGVFVHEAVLQVGMTQGQVFARMGQPDHFWSDPGSDSYSGWVSTALKGPSDMIAVHFDSAGRVTRIYPLRRGYELGSFR